MRHFRILAKPHAFDWTPSRDLASLGIRARYQQGGRSLPYINIGPMDDLYLSMICLEHAHYLVAMQDHVQINKYTPLPVSRVVRGSLRLAPNNYYHNNYYLRIIIIMIHVITIINFMHDEQ